LEITSRNPSTALERDCDCQVGGGVDWSLRLTRKDSTVCMAESKSNYFACLVNVHSEKKSKFE